MSAISLSAAVASLKPGLSTSPEVALNSWTVIKGVSDTLYSLTKTNHVLAATTTGLIATALLATLIRARLPTIQTPQRNPAYRSIVVDTLNAATSAVPIIYCTYYSISQWLSFWLYRRSFQRLSEAIDLLQLGTTTPYDTALVNWNVIEVFAEKFPKGIAQLQRNSMWIGIAAAIAAIATFRVIHFQWRAEQPEQYSLAKLWLDCITMSNLGLATGLSLYASVYAKTHYPKFA